MGLERRGERGGDQKPTPPPPPSQDRVEVCSLGTPITSEHYIASAGGSSYGTSCTPSRSTPQPIHNHLQPSMAIAINFPLHIRSLVDEWMKPETPIPGLYLSGQVVASSTLLDPPRLSPALPDPPQPSPPHPHYVQWINDF